MFCTNCGAKLIDGAPMCAHCGTKLNQSSAATPPTNTTSFSSNGQNGQKNKLGAAFLALFFGCLGMHQFYLGYFSKGITMLLLTTVGACFFFGPFISIIWALVDAIRILTGSYLDAQGNPLQD